MKKLLLLLPLITLTACGGKVDDTSLLDFVNKCIETQFKLTYAESEIIVQNTKQVEIYYLTDIYYRIVFDNSVFKIEYISAIDSENNLIIKEVQK